MRACVRIACVHVCEFPCAHVTDLRHLLDTCDGHVRGVFDVARETTIHSPRIAESDELFQADWFLY